MNPPASAPSVVNPRARVDLPPAELSQNARTVLAKRYLKKDEAGKPIEEPEEMFWRVASVIAAEDARYGATEEEIEALAGEFYLLMTRRLFEPNSPTLMNAGRPLGQLSACFVLPVEDALSNGQSGIYDTLRSMALVHQSGGGTGFSFSRLRPSGDIVRSTTGVASGPVSFMSLYDSSTEVVKQGGTRRGANMGILRVDHPDILDFIDCKQDITRITNFNISVAVTDAFMTAVEKGEEYELKTPRTGEVAGRLNARTVWDKIVQNAWRTGEPGVFFIDRANHYNPVPHLGSYEATNPCLTGDAQVLTVEGPRRFDELAAAGDDVLVHAVDRETGKPVVRWMRSPRLTRRDVPVIELEFDSGLKVRCTPDHHWIGLEGEKLRASALCPGMRVQAFLLREVLEPSFVPANHRVVAVRDAGRADVYNGTVDDVHTYVVCDSVSVDPASAHTGVVSANCGEQPLLPYDVCNLGSVNVGAFVRTDVEVDAPWYEKIDWKEYRRVVRLSTHFLDNVIDANQYPLPEIHDLAHRIRRIGLGVMGFADLLVRIGIPYDSEEGVEVGRRIMEFMDEESKKESEVLAEKRGVFPEWEHSIWGPDETAARAPNGERIRPMRRLRNCNVTTVAPTGTISIFAGCSSGIEPLFAVAFMRNQAGALMPDVNEDFVRIAREQGWYSEALMQRIAEEGHIHFPEVPEEVQRTFVTAHDITPEWHVRMQAGFQEYTDSAISKCIVAGTLIPTDKGLVPVEAFAAEHAPDTFAQPNDEYRTGQHRILSHYRAGQKRATRIRLDNGAELVGATESHRVLTPDGWKLMSELAPGDFVLGRFQESHGPGGAALQWEDDFRTCATALPTPRHMTPAFARFLGMLAADGYTLEADGRVEITCKNDFVGREFRRLCQEIFGVEPKETLDRRNQVKRLYLTSRNLVRFIESLIGRGAYHKHAPAAILRGSFEEKLNFLEGITLDGYATPQGLVLYGGMSKTLAYHVAELARSFGLPWVAQGRKWVKETEGYAYDVVISNELQELITPIEPHKRSQTVYKRYKVLAEVMAMSRSQFAYSSTEYNALRTAQNSGRRHLFNTTAARLGLPTDTLLHRVTEVEAAGVVELYDVEVEHAHEYVVNGMVSHNTTNFPHDASVDDVRQIYELAFSLGCKGVTVYRDGSRDNQVLSTGATKTPAQQATENEQLAQAKQRVAELEAELKRTREAAQRAEVQAQQVRRQKRRRPDVLRGVTRKMTSPLGDVFVTINEDEQGNPFEVFAVLGKAGSIATADAEAVGRLISLALRFGVPVNDVHSQLRGISSDRAIGFGLNKVLSVPDAIAQAIELREREKLGIQQELIPNGSYGGSAPAALAAAAVQPEPQLALNGYDPGETFIGVCPDCQSQLEFAEGCMKCHACGYSECG